MMHGEDGNSTIHLPIHVSVATVRPVDSNAETSVSDRPSSNFSGYITGCYDFGLLLPRTSLHTPTGSNRSTSPRCRTMVHVMDAPLHHTQSAPTLATLPEDVISYIINFVEVDWRPLILFDSNTGNLRPTDVSTDTLTQLSLVHRSWTRPAQKAAGRRLVITLGGHLDSASAQLRRAIDSSLFGPWTKYAYLDCSLVDAMLSVPQSMSKLKSLNERRSCPSEVNDHFSSPKNKVADENDSVPQCMV